MKGKKVLKVLMATMVIVTMLAQVSVFADVTYTTSTTYDATSGKALVTTTVTGADASEEVTIKVAKGEDILYIDQANNATDSNAVETFTYLVDGEDADGTASVKVATTSVAASATKAVTAGTDDTIKLNVQVNFNANEGGVVFLGASNDNTEYVYAENGSTSGVVGANLDFYVAPAAGYVYNGYTLNGAAGTPVSNANGVVTIAVVAAAQNNIVFNFEAIETITATAPTITTFKEENNATTTQTTEDFYVSTFASLDMTGVTEFGILVDKGDTTAIANSYNAAEIAALTTTGDSVRKYQAFGHFEGKYGIKLENGTSGYLSGKVNIKPYAVYKTGEESSEVALGAISTVSFGQ